MKPDRWQKVDEIFHAALQHKPDERSAFIEKACQGDEAPCSGQSRLALGGGSHFGASPVEQPNPDSISTYDS